MTKSGKECQSIQLFPLETFRVPAVHKEHTSGTLMYSVMLSHSGTLMYSVMLSHSGTLMYSTMGSHSGTLINVQYNGEPFRHAN